MKGGGKRAGRGKRERKREEVMYFLYGYDVVRVCDREREYSRGTDSAVRYTSN